MAMSSWCLWRGVLVAVTVLVALNVLGEVPTVKGAVSPSQCKEEQRLLVNACRPMILGRNPTADCCQRIRVTHFECVCPLLTEKLAKLFQVERTIKQIESCGRVIPHHFKCGSITTP